MLRTNPIQNRFMRQAMYVHKRQHGATVVIRRKVEVQTDPKTGESIWQIRQWRVRRAVVLPAKTQREVKQNAGAMAANRAIIQGSYFDTSARHFLFDRRDLPDGFILEKDDWLVFNNRHYDIESIAEYEYDAAWLVIAKELKGRTENAQELPVSTTDQLVLDSDSTATK